MKETGKHIKNRIKNAFSRKKTKVSNERKIKSSKKTKTKNESKGVSITKKRSLI